MSVGWRIRDAELYVLGRLLRMQASLQLPSHVHVGFRVNAGLDDQSYEHHPWPHEAP